MVRPAQAEGLHDARLGLHWAAQLLAAVGASLGNPTPDFSHTALSVRDRRIVIEVHGITVSLDESGAVTVARGTNARTLPLAGGSFEDALEMMRGALVRLGVDADSLERPEHDLPDHPVGRGANFDAFGPEAGIVLSWLSVGWKALERLEARPKLSATHLWPHHFDVARLCTLGATNTDKAIGFGLSPGQGTYAMPYFYVTPWPYPGEDETLPDLADGHWHREGWTGAVLLGNALIAEDEIDERVDRFLRDASRACETLVQRA